MNPKNRHQKGLKRPSLILRDTLPTSKIVQRQRREACTSNLHQAFDGSGLELRAPGCATFQTAMPFRIIAGHGSFVKRSLQATLSQRRLMTSRTKAYERSTGQLQSRMNSALRRLFASWLPSSAMQDNVLMATRRTCTEFKVSHGMPHTIWEGQSSSWAQSNEDKSTKRSCGA